MFTLKIKKDETGMFFISDDEYVYGGIDITQRYAFEHLFPSGIVSTFESEKLSDLAALHGWEIKLKS